MQLSGARRGEEAARGAGARGAGVQAGTWGDAVPGRCGTQGFSASGRVLFGTACAAAGRGPGGWLPTGEARWEAEAGVGAGEPRDQPQRGPGAAKGPWLPAASPRFPHCPRMAAPPSRPATSRTPSGSTARTAASSCASTPTAAWTESARRATHTVSRHLPPVV